MIQPKHCAWIFLIFIFRFSFGQTGKELRLPLEFVTGYGPFQVDRSAISFSPPPSAHPLYKSWTTLQFAGVPTSLKAVEKGIIWIDFQQFLYQNTQQGNLPQEVYKEFSKERQFIRNEEDLSKQPIACYVLVVKGTDEQGKEVLILDTNHDNNFSDESIINTSSYRSNQDFEESTEKSVQVSYQTVIKNKVVSRTIPLLIFKNTNQYLYSFPQYGIAQLKQSRGITQIAVSHEFRFPNYEIANVSRLSKQKALKDSIARKNQYLIISGQVYKNKGVDFASLSLILEETNSIVSNLEGTQRGMQAIQFNGKDVITNGAIALDDFKGKYLFIDFWGSWCAPCVGQLKKLSDIYDGANKAKVAFLGIAGKDDIGRLRKMITEKNILWPNIFSDDTNPIIEKYDIVKYPTGLLIDPMGKVVETDVSALNLEALLRKYLNSTNSTQHGL